ncbi:hypothetical protein EMU01_28140 [Enterococcus mundtii]|uniref:Uncharacterized protein n=1 Tax=Enterococcus mundtii TaxID=53346 RepID=A0AAI8R920_ENTMU|nr:uncharacterized protein EM151A_1289 [Enterococcus mundtii]GEL81670.1 hypothetical protein EMU01_28140 [Enterococcus mundtii]GEN20161.1 hypothetical protein LAC02_34420 [Ligilactobacillus acidipiscis]GKS56387.1 hypothetical protein EMLAB_30020 [Enterococcus mundtii]
MYLKTDTLKFLSIIKVVPALKNYRLISFFKHGKLLVGLFLRIIK